MTVISSQRSRGVEPMRWTFPYDPSRNPKQVRFHSVKAKEKLFGGSAGGGKTAAMLAEVLMPCLNFGMKTLILRRNYPALLEIIQRLQEIIPPEVGKWNESKKLWKFRNGGMLVMGNLDTDVDVRRYVGAEYCLIAWDELTQFTEWQYKRLFHPLRVAMSHPGYDQMTAAGIEPYYISATNPGDIGHGWVRERFIDPAPEGVVWKPSPTALEPNPGTRVFIPSRLTDNPYNSPDYINNLRSMDEDEQRMLIDGDWDVYKGQMFKEFRRDIHVIEPEEMPIPLGGIQKVMGVDYGVANPFSAHWIALFPDNLHVVYREVSGRDLLAREQAELILKSERPGERRQGREIPVYLDPSCWAREATSPKPESVHTPPRDSIAWHYKQAGLPIKRANNDRLAGVSEVKRLLRTQRDKKPRLLVYNTCTELIRTLPTLPRSKTHPEDVDTNADDHYYDSLRYGLMASRRIPPHESHNRQEERRSNKNSTPVGAPTSANGNWNT